MTEPSARVIADSISPLGHRVTTFEVVMHRFVLAEFNTHRVLIDLTIYNGSTVEQLHEYIRAAAAALRQ